MNDFGKRVMDRAKEIGIRSGAELARRIGYPAGQERGFNHYLTGRNQLDADILLKLAKALQVDVNFLLGTIDATDQEILDIVRQATPDQKAALVTFIRPFIERTQPSAEDEAPPPPRGHNPRSYGVARRRR